MSKGDIFSYSATGDTLADIEYSENKQADYYVTAYDDASGDISLYNLNKDAKWVAAGGTDADTDAYTVVDSKNTVILFVDSDAGKGETGYTMADIVKTTCLLDSIADFGAMNEVYASQFEGTFPARSAVAVKTLPKNGLVEIEVIAVKE